VSRKELFSGNLGKSLSWVKAWLKAKLVPVFGAAAAADMVEVRCKFVDSKFQGL